MQAELILLILRRDHMYHDAQLIYGQSTLDLISEQPLISEEAIAILDQLQRKHNVILPASVREWYSLYSAVSLLKQYSNDDHPVGLEQLGEVDNWLVDGRYQEVDFV